jgi:leucyl/phenylalanyl-tRNA---protein transferase
MIAQDQEFPYLHEHQRIRFPAPRAGAGGLVGSGLNLSPGVLLSAYEQGVFPWYSEGDPVLWHSPDPRFVLLPEDLHVSSSMRKVLKKTVFEIRQNTAFEQVMRSCSKAPRPGQDGTWITEDMISAYCSLHRLGYAISSEAWQRDQLVGGCYGVRLGKAFFGESMFAFQPNASKAAFLSVAQDLFASGIQFIDCQVYTDHLASLGAREMPRKEFIHRLRAALA